MLRTWSFRLLSVLVPRACALAREVLRKVRMFIETELIGDCPVRSADFSIVKAGPLPMSLSDVQCYDKANPRHTALELAKYMQCSRRHFQDPFGRFAILQAIVFGLSRADASPSCLPDLADCFARQRALEYGICIVCLQSAASASAGRCILQNVALRIHAASEAQWICSCSPSHFHGRSSISFHAGCDSKVSGSIEFCFCPTSGFQYSSQFAMVCLSVGVSLLFPKLILCHDFWVCSAGPTAHQPQRPRPFEDWHRLLGDVGRGVRARGEEGGSVRTTGARSCEAVFALVLRDLLVFVQVGFEIGVGQQ